DLYLWKKDYRNAIDCYYNLIRDKKYAVDGVGNRSFWANDEGTSEFPHGDYLPLASSVKKENTLAVVTFSSSSEYGSVSDLHNIFGGDWTVTGSHQVAAAPGLYGLSKRQAYCYYNDRNSSNPYVVYNPQREKTGDVRIYQNVQDNLMNDETGIKYNGFITKYSGGAILMNGLTSLRLGRPVQTYLRLAEALAGLAAEESTEITVGGAESGTIESSSWEGAEAMAMHILKYGLGVKEGKDVALKHNGKFEIKKRLNDTPDTTYVMVEKLDENGEVILVGAVDEEGNPIMEPVLDEEGNPVMIAAVDAEGNPIMEPVFDEEGNPVLNEDGTLAMQQKMVAKEQQKMVAEMEEKQVITFMPDYDVISFDFSEAEYKGNMGIHSFGSGNADRDVYYTIDNDSVIAAYFDIVDEAEPIFETDEEGNKVIGEDGNPVVKGVDYGITHAMKIEYLRNLILDECALETAFEGYRFTDLIRFAKAMGKNDVLAKRVAARAFENKVNMHYDTEGAYGSDGSLLKFEYDEALYNTLSDESNWYLPLK
ncbi:MAG: RagB/SusD family nutrient uptake outer membrane protein, partial [Bacteroidaceae bacterium]|nr:RagB/SusD family nutrient uptake outer membrane protein [Bacteroidaceae bacterium]